MHVKESDVPGDMYGLLEVLICLPGKAADDVGGDSGFQITIGGQPFIDLIDHFEVLTDSVLAVHHLENVVRPGLQGQMQVRHDHGGIGDHRVQQRPGHIARFEGTDPKSFETRNLCDRIDKIGQRTRPSPVQPILLITPESRFMSVSADKNTGQNNFLVPKIDQASRLFHHIGYSL